MKKMKCSNWTNGHENQLNFKNSMEFSFEWIWASVSTRVGRWLFFSRILLNGVWHFVPVCNFFFLSHFPSSFISIEFFSNVHFFRCQIFFHPIQSRYLQRNKKKSNNSARRIGLKHDLFIGKTDNIHIWPVAILYFNFLLGINCNALQWLNHIHAYTNLFQIFNENWEKNDNNCIKCQRSNVNGKSFKYAHSHGMNDVVESNLNRKYLPSFQWDT